MMGNGRMVKKDGINIYEIISLDGLLSAEKLISLEDLDRIKNYRSQFKLTTWSITIAQSLLIEGLIISSQSSCL